MSSTCHVFERDSLLCADCAVAVSAVTLSSHLQYSKTLKPHVRHVLSTELVAWCVSLVPGSLLSWCPLRLHAACPDLYFPKPNVPRSMFAGLRLTTSHCSNSAPILIRSSETLSTSFAGGNGWCARRTELGGVAGERFMRGTVVQLARLSGGAVVADQSIQ